MAETASERFERWRLGELLVRHPGLRIQPGRGDGLTLSGPIHFRATGPRGHEVEDNYLLELNIPSSFPNKTPLVREMGGRIAPTFHMFEGGNLCLGAPTELRIRLIRSPTLPSFVEQIVVPYLYGHTYFQAHGTMPFDELEHGADGLLDHFASLFASPSQIMAREFVRLASLPRRIANKHVCPCGKGVRLGRCCNRRVIRVRGLLGRAWFRSQVQLLDELG
jgi:hypothetical protein